MPTAISEADFRTRFPEFSEVADAQVTLAIEDSELEIDESVWSGIWPMGVTWLSAHFLATRFDFSGNPLAATSHQVMTQRTVDKVSATFADQGGFASGADAQLNTTRYGQEFLRLRARVVPSSFIAA